MTTSIDPFTARAAARLRHPAGTAFDRDQLSAKEREVLLHALAARRWKLSGRRRELTARLREMSAEVESIDRDLDDIEQSETWLLS